MIRRTAQLSLFAAILWGTAACQPLPPTARASVAQTQQSWTAGAPAAKMPAVVRTSCRGCHAPVRHLASPNPAAPSFADIANMEGLTRNTLAAFLRDAHNYPEQMNMELSKEEVNEIVDYILTLRDPLYRPMPS